MCLMLFKGKLIQNADPGKLIQRTDLQNQTNTIQSCICVLLSFQTRLTSIASVVSVTTGPGQ